MTEVPLSNGGVALIDDSDLHAVHEVGFSCGLIWRGTIAGMAWRAKEKNHTTYAVCSLQSALTLSLHRVVMDAKANQLVDHRDGDGLNCIRRNLRITDFTGNSRNRQKGHDCSSRFKGVSLHKASGKWSAQIKVNRVKHYLGLFATEQEAAAAYDTASKELHGEFARPNVV